MSIYQRAALAAMFLLPTLAAAEPPAAGPDQPLYHGKTPEFWTRQLNDDDALAREEAIAVLADAGPAAESALPALKELLKDPTATVRLRAAVAVWKVGRTADGVTPTVIEALNGSNRAGRLTGLQVLTQLGPAAQRALPEILATLSDPDADVRQAAGDALDAIGAAAMPALSARLTADDPTTRREAVAALERLGDEAKSAVPDLKKLLQGKDMRFRTAAARAVLRAEPDDAGALAVLIDAVKGGDVETRRQAGEALLRLWPRPKSAAPAYAVLLKGPADIVARLQTAEAFWDAGGDAGEVLPVLTEAIKGGDSDACYRALVILARLGPRGKEALPVMLPLLEARSLPDVTGDAFAALGPDSVPPLLDLLRNKPSAGQAVNMLGGMGPDAAPAVLKLLNDPDRRLRSTALMILGQIGPSAPGVMDALAAAAHDKDLGIRLSALSALGATGPAAKVAESDLLEALRDKEVGVRSTAIQVLPHFRLDGAEAGPALTDALNDADPYVPAVAAELRWRVDHKTGPALEVLTTLPFNPSAQDAAWRALGRIAAADREAIPALAERLKAPDPQTRLRAVLVLEQVGPNAKVAIPALVGMLKDNDALARVKAARLLAWLGAEPAETVPVLLADMKAPVDMPAWVSAEALGGYGKDDAAPALRRLLNEPELVVREAAALALTRIDPSARADASFALLEGLSSSPNRLVCMDAAAALCRVEPGQPRGLRLLRDGPSDGDPFTRTRAYFACGAAGPGGVEILPLLERAMADETPINRAEAAAAAWKVSRGADKPVAALTACLRQSPASMTRVRCATILGKMGAAAKPASPALMDALKDRSSSVRFTTADALRKVDPETADKAGIP